MGAAAFADRGEQDHFDGEQDDQMIDQVAGRHGQELTQLGYDHDYVSCALRRGGVFLWFGKAKRFAF